MPALAPPPSEPAAEAPPVDKSGERVRRMFAAIAGRYDGMNRVLSGGLDQGWRRRVARADLGAGPVLDCCTGTGDLAFAVKERHPGLRVVGADFTRDMLAVARRKDRGRGVSFVEADGLALPFAEAAFSAVTVGFGLRNFADTRRGLDELTRVLAPGGSLLILETSKPTNPVLLPLFRLHFRYVVPGLGRLLAGNPNGAYDYLPASAAAFPDGEALCELMRDAGLTECRFTPLLFGAATFYTARKPAGASR